MNYLPARPDLEQLRHQAKDLLREATAERRRRWRGSTRYRID